MGTEARRWTLYWDVVDGFRVTGDGVQHGESVPVVEAVLTPELGERVAMALLASRYGEKVAAVMRTKCGEDWLRTLMDSRRALKAAGFSESSLGGDPS